jgi:glycosyltransferase involved in cell wall biosynthesis
MRGLFVSTHYPANFKTDVFGVYKRQDLFLEALSGACTDVDALFFVPPNIRLSPEYVTESRAAFTAKFGRSINLSLCPQANDASSRSRYGFYVAPIFNALKLRSYAAAAGAAQVAAFEGCLSRNPDLVFVHRLYAAAPVLKSTSRCRVPILLDLDEVEHRWFFRNVGEPPRWLLKHALYLHILALFVHELKTLRRMTRAYVASPRDQRYLGGLGSKNVVTVPNVVANPAIVPPVAKEPVVLFVGSFRYQPNITAANILSHEIWPQVSAALPQARLILAGQNPENLHLEGGRPANVELPGFVDDIAALYARAQIVCCPIFTGGGTRLKLIEAAAYARAIVSTPTGAEGIDLQDDVSALLRSSNDALANSCIELLRDPQRVARLGAAARAVFLRDYDRDSLIKQLSASFRELVDTARAARAPVTN